MLDAAAEQVRLGPYAGALTERITGTAREALSRLGARLDDPSVDVLSAGRNRNVRLRLPGLGGDGAIVVKAFGPQNRLKDAIDRVRGSKAARTWRAAAHLAGAGVGTPAPLGYLDRWEGARLRESYYLSACAADAVAFGEELIRLYRCDPVCWKLMTLLECVARAVRAMHDGGLLHNDLGNQNILLRRIGDGAWADVQFIDLNRARIRPALSPRRRARDISRINLPSDFLRVFKEMYWRAPPPPAFQRWERRYRRAYAVHAGTRKLRHPVRTLRRRRAGEASADPYPAPRDIWIWDERSAQAVSTMLSRDRKRFYTPSWIVRPAAATLAGLPGVWREYTALRRQAYSRPVALAGRIGVAVDPRPHAWDGERAALAELGPVSVMVRLYRHESSAALDFRLQAVRQLYAAGYRVSVALVQDRRAVAEPEAWRGFLDSVAGELAGRVEFAEVGHAINRVKWGVWSFREYRRFLEPVAALAAARPELRLTGPAAIDFEYPFVLAALRSLPPGLRFAALSHHLYVDRRGAPENRQGRFAALEKFALARAIARRSGVCEDRVVVSEVNWPLRGTGVYSPVGSPYESPGPRFNDPSVDETAYAAFMVRYFAIALCSGMIDRVYWWRLAARGYGLMDDADPRRLVPRPAYAALRALVQTVGHAAFVERRPAAAGVHHLLFEREGRRVGIAWSAAGPRRIELPAPAGALCDMAGRERAAGVRHADLDGSPVYLLYDA